MNFIDLFSGIGGFALGVEWSNLPIEKHFYSEVDEYANRVYRKNFPKSIPLGDIRKIDFSRLKAEHPDQWFISGGFPCQDISIAGKGKGIDGERSNLWYHYWQAIGILQPDFAIIENVSAFTFRGLDRVLANLAEIGYDAEWQNIRASDLGAPHKRERIWVIAYPNGEKLREQQVSKRRCSSATEPANNGKQKYVAYPKRQREPQQKGVEQEIRRRAGDGGPKVADASCKLSHGSGSTRHGRRQPANQGWWETQPDVGRVADGIPSRVDRLRGLGNSVVPQIVALIVTKIQGATNE